MIDVIGTVNVPTAASGGKAGRRRRAATAPQDPGYWRMKYCSAAVSPM